MALKSMTGFARADGASQGWRFAWELRSVNGKSLDLRLRLPAGQDALETALRERMAKKVSRGSVSGTLSLNREKAATTARVNEDVLAAVLDAISRIGTRVNAQPPSLDGLLSFKGVVEIVEEDETPDARAALEAAILLAFDRALDGLVSARADEGRALYRILTGHLDEMARLRAEAEAAPGRSVEAIRQRLADQVAALIEASSALDPGRLHQEAVILATKADIREELDRLEAHIEQARTLLNEDQPVGRRLDFLSQEFNREVNTLCSKAADRTLTRIGLDLKAVVDQFREQIANIE